MHKPKHISNLLRRRTVEELLHRSKAAIYSDIALGLLPRAIRIAPKCVVWPLEEINAILAARTRGGDDEAIRALVVELTAKRQQVAA